MAARNGSRRGALLSPDLSEKPAVLLRSGCRTTGRSAAAPQKRGPRSSGHCVCRRALRLLRFVGGSVVQALSYISRRRSSSAKVSPKTSSRQLPPPRESHHAEAIEDCIRFINSSSRRLS